MALSEKALGYIVIFIAFNMLASMCLVWLKTKIYILSNMSSYAIHKKKIETLKNRESLKTVYQFLYEKSANQTRTRRLLVIYYLLKLPVIIGIPFAIIGLFTHRIDNLLDKYALIMTVYIMILGISPIFFNRGL